MPRSIGHKLFAVSAAIALTASIALPRAIADSSSTPQNNTSEPEKPREPQLSMSDGSGLGIGMLTPGGESSSLWLQKTQIVLFDRPQGKEIGKLDHGILQRNGQPNQALTVAPLYAYYDANVFLVLGKQRNEWFHIRYQVGQGNAGTAWVKASQFQKGGMPLIYISWQQYIMDNPSPIEPIGENQYIHQQPTTRSKSLVKFQAGYSVKPLQIQGDWLKVQYKSNVDACEGIREAPKKPKIFTGWTRWRKNGQILVNIPEKGC